jgi:ribosomal protein L37AE/L43A
MLEETRKLHMLSWKKSLFQATNRNTRTNVILTYYSTVILLKINSLYKNDFMPIDVKCPKCGSPNIERRKNQEHQCGKCGYVFYFVTPECGSQMDFSRYEF